MHPSLSSFYNVSSAEQYLSFCHLIIPSEVLEAARKKEEYQRRHMAGETEGAQREIAQLAIVKARREAAAKYATYLNYDILQSYGSLRTCYILLN